MHQRLTELLRYQVEQLRLVLLTRSDPALPLHRLRLNDQLGELRARDLAFGAADATYLFAVAGPRRRRATDAALLVERTEGWPAGLRLAALAPQPRGRPGAPPASPATTSPSPATSRRRCWPASRPSCGEFLLRTSVAERLTSDLARQAHRSGASPAPARGPWRRPTRSSSVSGRAGSGSATTACSARCCSTGCAVDSPELVPELHRTAAGWFAGHGQVIEALGTRRRRGGLAGSWGACSWSRGFPHAGDGRAHSAPQRPHAQSPPSCFGESVDLAVVRGAARMFYERRWPELEHLLGIAWAPVGSRASPGPDRGRASCCSPPTMARVQGDAEAVGGATRPSTLQLLCAPGGSEDPTATAYRAIAQNNLGSGRAVGSGG